MVRWEVNNKQQTFGLLGSLPLVPAEVGDHHLGDVERVHLVLGRKCSHLGEEGEHGLKHVTVALGHDQVEQLQDLDHQTGHLLPMFVQELSAANVKHSEVIWDDGLGQGAQPQLEEISALKHIDLQRRHNSPSIQSITQLLYKSRPKREDMSGTDWRSAQMEGGGKKGRGLFDLDLPDVSADPEDPLSLQPMRPHPIHQVLKDDRKVVCPHSDHGQGL